MVQSYNTVPNHSMGTANEILLDASQLLIISHKHGSQCSQAVPAKATSRRSKNRETQAQATVTKQNQDVINIDSSEEEFLDNNEHNEYDQNNINILRFVENNIADDDDEYDCDEGLLVERLWPVF